MTGPVDIGEQFQEILRLLGFDEPAFVREVTFRPKHAVAVVYRKNEDGKKFVADDGEVAVDHVPFEVKTW